MNFKLALSALSLTCLFAIFSTSIYAQQTKNAKYEIAPAEYEVLAEKSLRHLEKFNLSDFYATLSDDIEYYLPDGDEGTRTALIGKEAVMGFWDTFQEKSGNDKLVMKEMVHIPLISKKELQYSKVSGVIVISYFSLELWYGSEKAHVRMNWGFHFNADKKIDKIYTYYDRTPIIEAAKRNFLKEQ